MRKVMVNVVKVVVVLVRWLLFGKNSGLKMRVVVVV